MSCYSQRGMFIFYFILTVYVERRVTKRGSNAEMEDFVNIINPDLLVVVST